jgi:hypothetical protein
LQQININEFVQEAFKRMLLEQKQATQENFIDSLLNPKSANDKLKQSVPLRSTHATS